MLKRAGRSMAGIAVVAATSAGATSARAQTPAVVILVRDAGSTAPLSGVQITLDHRPTGDTTDADGIARLLDTPVGKHVVGLRRLGYTPVSDSIVVIRGKRAMVERQLRAVARALPGVTTTAEPIDPQLEGFMRRRAKGGGFFFTRGAIDSSHTRTLDQLLRGSTTAGLIPGPGGQVYLASRSAQLQFGICWVQIFLDGAFIYHYDPHIRTPPPDLKGFLTSQIEAVEFYPNPATTPVQFREGTPSCGTLVLWSRMH